MRRGVDRPPARRQLLHHDVLVRRSLTATDGDVDLSASQVVDAIAGEKLGADSGPALVEVAQDRDQQGFEMVEEGDADEIEFTGHRLDFAAEAAGGQFDLLGEGSEGRG